jgi:hypothetical protein
VIASRIENPVIRIVARADMEIAFIMDRKTFFTHDPATVIVSFDKITPQDLARREAIEIVFVMTLLVALETLSTTEID